MLASLSSSGFLVAAGVSGDGLAVADLDVSPYCPCPAGIMMVTGGTAASEEGDGGEEDGSRRPGSAVPLVPRVSAPQGSFSWA